MSIVANAREMRYDCPYCKKEKGCCSLFFWAVRLTAEDYQALVKLGWCRCGRMVYFPINQKCCCPQHSMRINALKFRQNRTHKRVRRRIERLQSGDWRPHIEFKLSAPETGSPMVGIETTKPSPQPSFPPANSSLRPKGSSACDIDTASLGGSQQPVNSNSDSSTPKKIHVELKTTEARDKMKDTPEILSEAQKRWKEAEDDLNEILLGTVIEDLKISTQKVKFSPCCKRKERGQFSTNAAFILASWIRKEKSMCLEEKDCKALMSHRSRSKKNKSRGSWNSESRFIAESLVASLRRRAKAKFRSKQLSFQVAGAGYINVEVPWLKPLEQAPTKAKKNSVVLNNKNPKLRLSTSVDKAHFSPEIFELYAKYQVCIHKDPVERITHQEFKAFLVDTPLVSTPSPFIWNSAWPHGCGSSFRMYHLEKEGDSNRTLVGFAVLDILPDCFYSSYFVWHPEARKLSLGVLSALEEIDIVQELANGEENPEHMYYIGYYVHSNKQMRYKRQYQPAELYCPYLNKWVSFDESTMKALERNPHGPLSSTSSNDEKALKEPLQGGMENMDESVLSTITLLWKHTIVWYKDVCDELEVSHPNLRSELRMYSQMVGPELASRMMYVVT